jgi:hypothetical protein
MLTSICLLWTSCMPHLESVLYILASRCCNLKQKWMPQPKLSFPIHANLPWEELNSMIRIRREYPKDDRHLRDRLIRSDEDFQSFVEGSIMLTVYRPDWNAVLRFQCTKPTTCVFGATYNLGRLDNRWWIRRSFQDGRRCRLRHDIALQILPPAQQIAAETDFENARMQEFAEQQKLQNHETPYQARGTLNPHYNWRKRKLIKYCRG